MKECFLSFTFFLSFIFLLKFQTLRFLKLSDFSLTTGIQRGNNSDVLIFCNNLERRLNVHKDPYNNLMLKHYP